MTEVDISQSFNLKVKDDFLEGKLFALQIVYEAYLELQIKGVRFLSVDELLQTLRTFILNLKEVKQ